MKGIAVLLLWTCIVAGCASAVSHDDDPAAVKRDYQGPVLCRDGTAPPCTPRG